jgi:hypothetical protein
MSVSKLFGHNQKPLQHKVWDFQGPAPLAARYAFPSAAISRNSRHATQAASTPLNGAAFSPSAVFTLTNRPSTE